MGCLSDLPPPHPSSHCQGIFLKRRLGYSSRRHNAACKRKTALLGVTPQALGDQMPDLSPTYPGPLPLDGKWMPLLSSSLTRHSSPTCHLSAILAPDTRVCVWNVGSEDRDRRASRIWVFGRLNIVINHEVLSTGGNRSYVNSTWHGGTGMAL